MPKKTGCSGFCAIESPDNAQLKLLDKYAPVRNESVIIRQKLPWYNAEVRTVRLERRRAEFAWRQSRLEVHREIYKSKLFQRYVKARMQSIHGSASARKKHFNCLQVRIIHSATT